MKTVQNELFNFKLCIYNYYGIFLRVLQKKNLKEILFKEITNLGA